MSRSYLLGALHDGTIRHRTIRISQKEEACVSFLKHLIARLGGRAWTYREGRTRNLYVVEFSRSFRESHRLRSRQDVIDYVRGYFDAEGGVSSDARNPYIYFAQKDLNDLEELRGFLISLALEVGKIHNPSREADPNHWRFYLRRKSIRKFVELVGSWHPRKSRLLQKMREHQDSGAHETSERVPRPSRV